MSSTHPHLRLPGFSAMLSVVVLGIVFFFLIHISLLNDPDIFWHLRNAQMLVDQHILVRTDLYSFPLNGHPWINPEWLSELPFYVAFKAFGLRGLEAITIFEIEALVAGIGALAWQRTRSLRAGALAAVIATVFLSVSFGPRTQLAGWLCLIAELAILQAFRAGSRGAGALLWCLPPLFALWINLHGSWPIGLVLFAAFLISGLVSFRSGAVEIWAWAPHQRTQLLIAGALIVPALFLNPFGWHLVVYPYVIGGQHSLSLAVGQEWQPVDFHGMRGRFIFVLVAILFVARALRGRLWNPYDAFSLFLALLAAFSYSRFLLFAGIIFCPLLADEFTFLGRDNPLIDKRLLNTAIIACILFFAITHVPTNQVLAAQVDDSQNYATSPVKAVEYLRQHPPAGAVFNDFNYGGYLIWHLRTQPVFIDSREDIFEEAGLLKTYLDITNLRQPIEDYNHGQFRYVLFPKSSALVAGLSRSPNWQTEYTDDTTVLLHRIR